MSNLITKNLFYIMDFVNVFVNMLLVFLLIIINKNNDLSILPSGPQPARDTFRRGERQRLNGDHLPEPLGAGVVARRPEER